MGQRGASFCNFLTGEFEPHVVVIRGRRHFNQIALLGDPTRNDWWPPREEGATNRIGRNGPHRSSSSSVPFESCASCRGSDAIALERLLAVLEHR